MADLEFADPLGLAGRTLADTYELLRPIGSGGFGAVYAARHLMLNRLIAVKVQRTQVTQQNHLIERFRREAEACWRLRNAGAVEVYDCRTDPATGRLFIAMELLTGRSLATRWLLAKKLPVSEAVAYVVQAARCIAVAHENGIIHRDLKPENIFLCSDGSVRILDFGSVLMLNAERLTKPGQFLGTTCYMPEEQLLRPTGDLDGRVDIYALGVVLYHLISGRMVYAPDEDVTVLRGRILRADPRDIREVAPEITERLANVIRRAMVRSREARYGSMHDFIEALLRPADVPGPVTASGTSREKDTLRVEPSKSLLNVCAANETDLTAKTVEQNAPQLVPTTQYQRNAPLTSDRLSLLKPTLREKRVESVGLAYARTNSAPLMAGQSSTKRPVVLPYVLLLSGAVSCTAFFLLRKKSQEGTTTAPALRSSVLLQPPVVVSSTVTPSSAVAPAFSGNRPPTVFSSAQHIVPANQNRRHKAGVSKTTHDTGDGNHPPNAEDSQGNLEGDSLHNPFNQLGGK